MEEKELQVENGNFTRIVNPLIDNLIKIPFKGCELSVALFIIRKTYGFQKKEDSISLSQFQEGVNRSRQTIVTALKNLELVNVARLVKRGTAKGDCNIWSINKYYRDWKLVNVARLVKRNAKPSLTERLNLVKTARHTKEITKEIQKKDVASATDWSFKEELRKLKEGNRKDYKIIALYWKKKNWVFENREQFNSALTRELKPAKSLKGYTGEQIAQSIAHCEKNYPEWTLETCFKRISDIVNK